MYLFLNLLLSHCPVRHLVLHIKIQVFWQPLCLRYIIKQFFPQNIVNSRNWSFTLQNKFCLRFPTSRNCFKVTLRSKFDMALTTYSNKMLHFSRMTLIHIFELIRKDLSVTISQSHLIVFIKLYYKTKEIYKCPFYFNWANQLNTCSLNVS